MIAARISSILKFKIAAKDNQFFYEFDMPPTDDEVDAFIISSEFFDGEMKAWLLSEVGGLIVNKNSKFYI